MSSCPMSLYFAEHVLFSPWQMSFCQTSERATTPCWFFFFNCIFTSYFMFSMAVLPHSPGVVNYHLLLRRETRIPRVPFSFRIGIWDLFVHRGQKSYTPTAFGKLWTTPGVRFFFFFLFLSRLHISSTIVFFQSLMMRWHKVWTFMRNKEVERYNIEYIITIKSIRCSQLLDIHH